MVCITNTHRFILQTCLLLLKRLYRQYITSIASFHELFTCRLLFLNNIDVIFTTKATGKALSKIVVNIAPFAHYYVIAGCRDGLLTHAGSGAADGWASPASHAKWYVYFWTKQKIIIIQTLQFVNENSPLSIWCLFQHIVHAHDWPDELWKKIIAINLSCLLNKLFPYVCLSTNLIYSGRLKYKDSKIYNFA